MSSSVVVDTRRVRKKNSFEKLLKGPIVYWMAHEQRVHNNWALLAAIQIANQLKEPLVVVFCLAKTFLNATLRQYDFLIQGLIEIEQELKKYGIAFCIEEGSADLTLPAFIEKYQIKNLVTDFSPLKINQYWKKKILEEIQIPFFEVDARHIIPLWEASPKLEFAAYTLRPKINKRLSEFLTPFPKLCKLQATWDISFPKIDFEKIYQTLEINHTVKPVTWLSPGEKAAAKTLEHFMKYALDGYAEKRNNPNLDAQSNLSPYLHFGQISAQEIALKVKDAKAPQVDKDAFLEELIVRRELSSNYCFYNANYDSALGFPDWAKETLKEHEKDPREYIYSLEEFEKGITHDPLWNAAQLEMVKVGKMHGYMRMYWAKKILEWSPNAGKAFEIAIYLNDKYELDGRDPNGYVGVAWSIGGVHDRAWFDRPIFGKIRYMNFNGCKSKFDVGAYIKKIKALDQ